MSNGSFQSNDLISALHDGELADHEREAAEQLLEESADSRAELEDYRALSELLRELPAVSPPEGLRAAVMRQIERDKPVAPVTSPASRSPRRWPFRVSVIAAALTAAAAVLLMLFVWPPRENNTAIVASTDRENTTEAAWDDARALPTSTARFRRNEMTDLAESSTDSPALTSTLDALAGSGGVAAASPAARPPDGFSIGDVYTYLEQTPDGNVMVVNAVVVDVRQAVDQLQVLLSQSEIPTVSVAVNEEYGYGNMFERSAGASGRASLSGGGASRGGAADGTALTDDAEQDVALYVESDPSRMNVALSKLGSDENFLSWEFAGVLDQTLPQVAESGAMRGLGETTLDFDEREAVEAERELAAPKDEAPSAGLRSEVRPQARGSVTDRAARVAQQTKKMLPEGSGKSAPLLPQREPAEPAESDAVKSQGDAKFTDLSNGYQTVLQVPRLQLEERLTASNAPEQSEAQPLGTNRYFFNAAGDAERRQKLAEQGLEELKQVELRHQFTKEPVQAQTQQQRRLRLLVVLEAEPTAAKALKARANSQVAPVEAPPPPTRKKG